MAWLSGLLLTALLGRSVAEVYGQNGATTSAASKRAIKVCNILEHGGVASRTVDNGPAIAAAWSACQAGGEVYIPAGEYGLGTWVSLANGKHIALNIEGTVFRTGSGPGNMFLIQNSDDVEVYSATGLGAIQGFGYEFHKDGGYGPRIMRVRHCTNFSVHDLALVDSPAFHLTLDNSTNGEVYNVIVHGGYRGGLDGIDVWGSNIWVHDVEVSNKDECVTVKSPANNILVESVHCNWSGGCAMGSLSTGTAISNIVYRNIYTHHSNQMYMIKSRGGSGTVSGVTLDNFIGHSNGYGFDVDTDWLRQTVGAGPGVSYSKITASNWKGTSRSGETRRATIRVLCSADVPCTNMLIRDVDIRNQDGSPPQQVCENAFGVGACLSGKKPKTPRAAAAPTTPATPATPDAQFVTPMLTNELAAPFDATKPIPIPAMPAVFFPGIPPLKPVLAHARDTAKST
ncbi:hypothetical protein E4U42_001621 [Claviceps africana]|uniref:Rhamnogalacturonase A n=1 Tax=Claviceps africana TaxID=83212 RepID=A0A8K0NLW3_9HYPO|nr:hypothetical protein E4U42_001621 [Claviceps africana]